ncbi:MAG: hypothetical protein HC904_06675 [Blastochloris sp.]|nr:hypothetical protein [Blastochloris sp.]
MELKFDEIQCQAMADIFVLAMCFDGHFSLAEEKVFHEKIEELAWESDLSPSTHVNLSIARARDVSESLEKTRAYLEKLVPVLKDPKVSAHVLLKTEKLLHADGFNAEEAQLLNLLKSLLR